MNDIKIKEVKDKTIKGLDKTVAWTERVKDPIVYLNDKSKDAVSNDTTITEYGEDKIKYYSNRAKDETIYAAKKVKNKGVNKIKEQYQKKKLLNKTEKTTKDTIKNAKKNIKQGKETIKKTEKAAKETTKASKRMLEQGRKLAIQGTKQAIRITKAVTKAVISGIKALIKALSSLIGALMAGSTVAFVIVIIICLVALLLASVFGIFFANEGDSKTMTSVISEVNQDLYTKADNQRFLNKTDDVEVNISSNNWKEVIATYSVKYSNDNDKDASIVMYLNEKNVTKLKNIYYDFNTIKTEIRYVEEETGEVQQSTNANYFNPTNSGVGNNNFNVISPPVINQPKPSSGGSSKLKSVLYITVESKDLDTMMNKYNFNEEQRKQVAELLDPKYDDLWMQLLYGTAGGDFVYWRQKNAPWSNIKIGNSNGTIGSIGCLVTSISILIEKSGVNDTIIPFNPGTFVEALNKNGAFDSDGNLSYAPITKVVPRFEYVGRVELAGKTKQEKVNLINKYQSQGYYLAVEVKGTTGQHWVAVMSVNGYTINMVDPGSDGTDMWSSYNWKNTSQFVYFKTK